MNECVQQRHNEIQLEITDKFYVRIDIYKTQLWLRGNSGDVMNQRGIIAINIIRSEAGGEVVS